MKTYLTAALLVFSLPAFGQSGGRTIEEHMRVCMTEKCQSNMALHCRGETPTKQELRAQCRAEFAAAKKK